MLDILFLLVYYEYVNRKDSEKKSNLFRPYREFLVGGKKQERINEDGLGVAYRTLSGKAMTVSPVTVIEYDTYSIRK